MFHLKLGCTLVLQGFYSDKVPYLVGCNSCFEICCWLYIGSLHQTSCKWTLLSSSIERRHLSESCWIYFLNRPLLSGIQSFSCFYWQCSTIPFPVETCIYQKHRCTLPIFWLGPEISAAEQCHHPWGAQAVNLCHKKTDSSWHITLNEPETATQ